LYLMFAGAGPWSLDHMLHERRSVCLDLTLRQNA
jgi:hypothetical protein